MIYPLQFEYSNCSPSGGSYCTCSIWHLRASALASCWNEQSDHL